MFTIFRLNSRSVWPRDIEGHAELNSFELLRSTLLNIRLHLKGLQMLVRVGYTVQVLTGGLGGRG